MNLRRLTLRSSGEGSSSGDRKAKREADKKRAKKERKQEKRDEDKRVKKKKKKKKQKTKEKKGRTERDKGPFGVGETKCLPRDGSESEVEGSGSSSESSQSFRKAPSGLTLHLRLQRYVSEAPGPSGNPPLRSDGAGNKVRGGDFISREKSRKGEALRGELLSGHPHTNPQRQMEHEDSARDEGLGRGVGPVSRREGINSRRYSGATTESTGTVGAGRKQLERSEVSGIGHRRSGNDRQGGGANDDEGGGVGREVPRESPREPLGRDWRRPSREGGKRNRQKQRERQRKVEDARSGSSGEENVIERPRKGGNDRPAEPSVSPEGKMRMEKIPEVEPELEEMAPSTEPNPQRLKVKCQAALDGAASKLHSWAQ